MPLFNVYPLYNVTPVKAKGVYVYDENKTEYLDLYGGHAVISIGHAHPKYVKAITNQVEKLGFYSNAIQNPLQVQLADKLEALSGCKDYELFLCNSGAEANENALKLASFKTNKSRVIAFKNGFHGRTSAAVAATDNKNIIAPINAQQKVTILDLNDIDAVKTELEKGDVCAVIVEFIQGVGGLDQATAEFFEQVDVLCKANNTFFIADEVQSGYGRSGKFFAYQHYNVTPDVISIAKGMGNGFPIGGILIHPDIEAKFGMLGTTFGGNHLACAAGLSVLKVIEEENLIDNVNEMSCYFMKIAKTIPEIKNIKGKGLMLGLEFDFEVGDLRKKLIYDYHIFTGGAMNKNLLRILPPLTLKKEHINQFFEALVDALGE
ncbi:MULTISPECIES: aspartate aminotransferase family protein [Polaribacter]|uniref:Aminotransferase class III-fold pyridoxal phosphate-dependent enzyme n=1 Tax=Polaribacter sejongensis TaxID=985043 RepID=A0AAJ1QVN4_9FLAO|nr:MULTISPECIES: aminotransferase class III-fold pyridoxal phosphate-dependent enzyme [Polaribacter]AUC22893.1 aspartate aminotransferase family protein [Polaribacter sejongensis]MDN3618830.1 aminotransferase class III-fold pyridoxal phosphate-dependent enzyme [Polaribacter undariae]UWD32920.1 aminotransferase class III-fold pyridoxal phosphate-dependent enzyme [Polaribacter undariae]